MKRVDLSGSKFGLLVVNAYAGLDSGGNAAWSCLCDCGASVVVRGSRLRSGKTASCGCLRSNSEARSVVVRGDGSLGKGDAHRSIYNTWTGAELDRIDNDLGYSPENCRWVDVKTNSRNRRSARMIDTPKGRMLLCEAAEASGLRAQLIAARIRRGVTVDRLFDPVLSAVV